MSGQILQYSLQVMAAGHGHKDMKYNPTDPKDVRRIKEYIKEKLSEGWILYGMKSGQKEMEKLADARKIDDKNLDRFILASPAEYEKKLLAQPVTGG